MGEQAGPEAPRLTPRIAKTPIRGAGRAASMGPRWGEGSVDGSGTDGAEGIAGRAIRAWAAERVSGGSGSSGSSSSSSSSGRELLAAVATHAGCCGSEVNEGVAQSGLAGWASWRPGRPASGHHGGRPGPHSQPKWPGLMTKSTRAAITAHICRGDRIAVAPPPTQV
ncbi:hypothetical protein BDZ91DRAFT_760428 [Kalaharituber pfeilii]|nr:hypothetical protein BDZ91DRAFT_760428 [Kalaharituber pfeilii]